MTTLKDGMIGKVSVESDRWFSLYQIIVPNSTAKFTIFSLSQLVISAVSQQPVTDASSLAVFEDYYQGLVDRVSIDQICPVALSAPHHGQNP